MAAQIKKGGGTNKKDERWTERVRGTKSEINEELKGRMGQMVGMKMKMKQEKRRDRGRNENY